MVIIAFFVDVTSKNVKTSRPAAVRRADMFVRAQKQCVCVCSKTQSNRFRTHSADST